LAQGAIVQHAQLTLEFIDRRRVQESKRDRALFSLDGVVHAVRLVKPLQIAAAGRVLKRPAAVNQAVVRDKVQETVGGHAGAYPFEGVIAFGTEINQRDCHPGENDGIQIVLLEPAGARFMVRAVPSPTETMHHIFVRDNRKQFHQHNGDQDDERVQYHGALRSSVRWRRW